MQIELPQEVEAELTRIAGESGLEPAAVAADVLRDYVERGNDFHSAVQRGTEQADQGELLDHDEVVRRIDDILK